MARRIVAAVLIDLGEAYPAPDQADGLRNAHADLMNALTGRFEYDDLLEVTLLEVEDKREDHLGPITKMFVEVG